MEVPDEDHDGDDDDDNGGLHQGGAETFFLDDAVEDDNDASSDPLGDGGAGMKVFGVCFPRNAGPYYINETNDKIAELALQIYEASPVVNTAANSYSTATNRRTQANDLASRIRKCKEYAKLSGPIRQYIVMPLKYGGDFALLYPMTALQLVAHIGQKKFDLIVPQVMSGLKFVAWWND